jgi:hypothetical protein
VGIVVLLTNRCPAETLRVTTWNLGVGSNTNDAARLVEDAAAALKALDPDVILLQRVQDWRMCGQLADALKPLDYSVLICSAFQQDSPNLPDPPQVAILSKRKAYVTWSEAWRPLKPLTPLPGVAFAAIQAGNQQLGLFTALVSDEKSRDELAQRLLDQLQSIGRWETNQVDTFVFAASFDPLPTRSRKALTKASLALEQAGLVDATEEIPPELKTTLRSTTSQSKGMADCLFAGLLGFPSNTRITAAPVSDHYPMTCDVELDRDKVATALEIRAEGRRQRAARARLMGTLTACGVGGALGLGLAIWLRRRIAAGKRTRSPVPPTSDLPARIAPTKAPSPLRPVIFAQSPDKNRAPKKPDVPQVTRPVLRLQSSPNVERQSADQQPSGSPPTPGPERPGADGPRNAVALQAPPLPRGPVALEPEVSRGVIQEISGWLKQKLVRRLVTDRTELMQAQQIAARMATTLDDRLGRIEEQIQKQNQAYVHRIEALNRELAEAREENRELIRERIAQVKAEMEAARARVIAEADLDNTSLRL